jgi:hypothetical protein
MDVKVLAPGTCHVFHPGYVHLVTVKCIVINMWSKKLEL